MKIIKEFKSTNKQDKYKFVRKNRTQLFLDYIKRIMPNIALQPMKLQSISPKSLEINANFNISPECVEGRDYYFLTNDKP